jgi:hypothetical protein
METQARIDLFINPNRDSLGKLEQLDEEIAQLQTHINGLKKGTKEWQEQMSKLDAMKQSQKEH